VILADTSVWIDHVRRGNAQFASFLERGVVMTHPFVLGELSMGALAPRASSLQLLNKLPQARQASHEEIVQLVEQRKLFGRGIGWVDAHLLGSALIEGVPLWSLDQPLMQAARVVGAAVDAV
jgi:predicted nucleic acid-binding protein